MANPAAGDLTISERTEIKAKDFREKLGVKDDYAGYKIKETADSVGIFGSIGALLLGVLMWSQLSGWSGFLIGLAIAAAGVAASCLLVSLLYNYGDMINISIEQAKTLKRLEAEKTEEMQQSVESETLLQSMDEAENPAQEPTADTEQEADVIDKIEEEGLIAAEELVGEEEKIDKDLPLQAYEVDRVERIARFAERSGTGVICPICFKWQPPEDNRCFRCSCEFIYDDNKHARTA